MLSLCPQGAHIALKRGIYQYRRRLPSPLSGELSVSLATPHYREAEYRAALLDSAFALAWRRATAMTTIPAEVRRIVREHLRQALEADLEQRLGRRPGQPVYTIRGNDADKDAVDDDLAVIADMLTDAREALALGNISLVADHTERLMRENNLPDTQRPILAHGLLEANVKILEAMRDRALGQTIAVLANDDRAAEPAASARDATQTPNPSEPDLGPRFSDLLPRFVEWRSASVRGHTVQQDRPTLRFFLEIAGDKPVGAYTRADVAHFLNTMRKFPSTYGRSPADKDRSASDIIARADRDGVQRVADKTVKRHHSVISRFFNYCFQQGIIRQVAYNELVTIHKFTTAAPARAQRDAWTSDELKALFASPVWAGCHPTFRSMPGPLVIRDARFWIPLLALFQGARLEELADLYRRDIDQQAGLWVIRITEESRSLKNVNASRVVPLHPELIRLGFPEYVTQTAPEPGDPVFPDLEPQGPDRKRGPRFTRWFVEYRKAIKLYRKGVGTHAFRHTANTRLRDVITDFQQERHVAYLLGHAQGGGEGRERYDKGPGLQAVAATLSLLRYPEIDVSRLYMDQIGTLPEYP